MSVIERREVVRRRLKRRLLQRCGCIIAAVLLACYVLLSPTVAAPLYSRLLFYPNYPSRYDAATYEFSRLAGVPKEEFYIPTSNGNKLHAWLFRSPDAKYVAVVNHGNAGNISDRKALAVDLLECGVSVLLYDYQGYGLSGGSPSIQSICDDGCAVFDYARDMLGYGGQKIILYGESLGCAVACKTSSERSCAGLILQSGFSSLKKIAGEKLFVLRAYPTGMFPKPRLDNAAVLVKAHPPLLLVHGALDRTVPVKHAEYLMKCAVEPKELVVLPNSGHFIAVEDHERFESAIRGFVGSLR